MPLPDAVLEQASGFVAARLGLNFPRERWPDLERALRPAAAEMGFSAMDAYVRWLMSAPLGTAQLELLASKLTIGETYFFREPQAFDAVRQHIVPQLVAARGPAAHLRVWSAGCCTGEEAYSLAICFERQCPGLRGWQISIIGTDINPHFLRKAREGVYGSWSFRSAPPWLQSEYFSEVGRGRFELRADLRRMVTFEHLNLADDVYPSLRNHTNGLDLIFCRNVLMYFSPAHLRRVVDGFHRSLVDEGHLIAGVCEATSALAPQFQPCALPGITVFRKTARREAARPPAAPAPLTPPPPLADSPAFRFTPPAAPAAAAPPDRVPRAEIDAAVAQLRRGEYAEAVRRLEAALAAAPLDAEAATQLARALANQGRLDDARRWIERAIAVEKLRAPLHYLRATVLQELGEPALATQALETAVYLDPDLVVAHVAIAELARSSGRSAKSALHLAHALRVLRRQPPDAVVAEADDLTAGRLIAIIEAIQTAEVAP
jgi:chemotaxis protein methyltransferase CheR